MTVEAVDALPVSERRRLIGFGLLRSLTAAAVVVALYYLVPLDHLTGIPLVVQLMVGLVVLAALTAYQVRATIRAGYPAVRAVEALASTVPLFLLLFAAIYFSMAQTDAGNFNVHLLTRTDALYFTVTVFGTVGFGDITATSQVARLMVTAQMVLDLLVLGLGIRVFIGAVQLGRHQHGEMVS